MMGITDFQALFNLPKDGWGVPVKLQDHSYGFSVYKDSKNLGFKSLIRVFIEDKELRRENDVVPVVVTATYGKESSGGITISSTEFARGIDWPLSLVSEKEFRYSLSKQEFYFKDSKIVPFDILQKVYRAHISPENSNYIRAKLYFHSFCLWLIKIVFQIVAWVNYLITNKKSKIYSRVYESPNTTTGNVKESVTEGDVIDLFGIKVPSSVAVLYALIHLIAFTIYYVKDLHSDFISRLFNNNFLLLMYVILSVAIFKKFFHINYDLRPILSLIQKLLYYFASMKIKVTIK
jgi:hypothetical protein